jgi:hypothetical protein
MDVNKGIQQVHNSKSGMSVVVTNITYFTLT